MFLLLGGETVSVLIDRLARGDGTRWGVGRPCSREVLRDSFIIASWSHGCGRGRHGRRCHRWRGSRLGGVTGVTVGAVDAVDAVDR